MLVLRPVLLVLRELFGRIHQIQQLPFAHKTQIDMQSCDFLLTLIHQLHDLNSKPLISLKSGHWQYSSKIWLVVLSYADLNFLRVSLIYLKLVIEAPLVVLTFKLSHSIIGDSVVLQL